MVLTLSFLLRPHLTLPASVLPPPTTTTPPNLPSALEGSADSLRQDGNLFLRLPVGHLLKRCGHFSGMILASCWCVCEHFLFLVVFTAASKTVFSLRRCLQSDSLTPLLVWSLHAAQTLKVASAGLTVHTQTSSRTLGCSGPSLVPAWWAEAAAAIRLETFTRSSSWLQVAGVLLGVWLQRHQEP